MKRINRNGQFYTLAEKTGFKQMRILPLGINEHSNVSRSRNLAFASDLQSGKSTINKYKEYKTAKTCKRKRDIWCTKVDMHTAQTFTLVQK